MYFTYLFSRIPHIILENAKGLSNEQIATLNEELIKQAQLLTGEVRIQQLQFKGQYNQGFHYDFKQPMDIDMLPIRFGMERPLDPKNSEKINFPLVI